MEELHRLKKMLADLDASLRACLRATHEQSSSGSSPTTTVSQRTVVDLLREVVDRIDEGSRAEIPIIELRALPTQHLSGDEIKDIECRIKKGVSAFQRRFRIQDDSPINVRTAPDSFSMTLVLPRQWYFDRFGKRNRHYSRPVPRWLFYLTNLIEELLRELTKTK